MKHTTEQLVILGIRLGIYVGVIFGGLIAWIASELEPSRSYETTWVLVVVMTALALWDLK